MTYIPTRLEGYYTKGESGEVFARKVGGRIEGFRERKRTLLIEDGEIVLDLNGGNWFTTELTESISSVVVTGEFASDDLFLYVIETVGAGVSCTVDFGDVKWICGAAPIVSIGSGESDVYVFVRQSGYTLGFVSGQGMI